MSVHAVISSGHRRIHVAQRWLENRAAAEEVLIVGATLDAANELARKAAERNDEAGQRRKLGRLEPLEPVERGRGLDRDQRVVRERSVRSASA